MKLIKIFSDRVQIKTDSEQLNSLKINDLLLLSDDTASLVCIVTGITGNDTMNIYDYDGESLGLTEENNTIECGILGSLTRGKFTKSIDVYPTAKVDISIIDKGAFSGIIMDNNASYFKLGTYANYDTNAMIDGNKFFQRHSAIVGNTGSGKSFAVSSVLEKMSRLKGSNVILFDLHGEYSKLSYVKSVKIGNGGLDFPVWFMPFRDIYSSLLKIKEESATLQLAALRKAYYSARDSKKSEDLPVAFEFDDMVKVLQRDNDEMIHTGEYYKTGDKAGFEKTTKGENNGKLGTIISLLEDKLIDKRYSFMCGRRSQKYIYEFVNEIFGIEEKNIKAIDLSDVPHDMIPTVVAVITKLMYSVQLQQPKETRVPITIICEEAHVYIPSSDFGLGASQRRLLEVFETIAKEGRKFGTTLCIVSQRPSELNKTIMAQCANFIVMKMSNEADKAMMKGILPDSSRTIIDMLSLFMPGDCLVIGDAAKITFKTRIDMPSEEPLSNTIDVWDVWNQPTEINTESLVDSLLSE